MSVIPFRSDGQRSEDRHRFSLRWTGWFRCLSFQCMSRKSVPSGLNRARCGFAVATCIENKNLKRFA
ncbi:hypothetical protein [Mesorhizobium helmanticense]|uniref:hypothetical protein n=1 Tax=Mesorhizobium helmanticense TaxID=1776423 RepID=UPI0011B1E654|nr:hypothetical protein [Mesorhizobium helmanticense]